MKRIICLVAFALTLFVSAAFAVPKTDHPGQAPASVDSIDRNFIPILTENIRSNTYGYAAVIAIDQEREVASSPPDIAFRAMTFETPAGSHAKQFTIQAFRLRIESPPNYVDPRLCKQWAPNIGFTGNFGRPPSGFARSSLPTARSGSFG